MQPPPMYKHLHNPLRTPLLGAQNIKKTHVEIHLNVGTTIFLDFRH